MRERDEREVIGVSANETDAVDISYRVVVAAEHGCAPLIVAETRLCSRVSVWESGRPGGLSVEVRTEWM